MTLSLAALRIIMSNEAKWHYGKWHYVAWLQVNDTNSNDIISNEGLPWKSFLKIGKVIDGN